MQKVLVIVGPTASGKSALGVKIAKKFDGEVISADSRQVYKGLNIGTGKITKPEMQGVPHYMLDVASPKRRFNASSYKKLASKKIEEIIKRKKLPIIVGGTGFYIDALRMTLPEVPSNQVLRRKLERASVAELSKMLGKHKIKDRKNKVRLIRAIEIVTARGKLPKIKRDNKYQFVFVGLKPKELDKLIERRVKGMFKQGLLEEVKKLKQSGLTDKRLQELGFEYWQPTIESVTRGTKQYAKRQMTWFKRNKEIVWLTFPLAASDLATIRRLLVRQR